MEGGIGYAFIRTTNKPGAIHISASSQGLKEGKASIYSIPYKGKYVPFGDHAIFTGKEEDNVVVKPTKWENKILSQPVIPVKSVKVNGSHPEYPSQNIIDGNETSWWIAEDEFVPQVITLETDNTTKVSASRIRFQKDSSFYRHKVEVSTDGNKWETIYERECSGWEFKPQPIGKEVRYFRLTINEVSEGRAGLAEITLFE